MWMPCGSCPSTPTSGWEEGTGVLARCSHIQESSRRETLPQKQPGAEINSQNIVFCPLRVAVAHVPLPLSGRFKKKKSFYSEQSRGLHCPVSLLARGFHQRLQQQRQHGPARGCDGKACPGCGAAAVSRSSRRHPEQEAVHSGGLCRAGEGERSRRQRHAPCSTPWVPRVQTRREVTAARSSVLRAELSEYGRRLEAGLDHLSGHAQCASAHSSCDSFVGLRRRATPMSCCC